MTIEEQKLAIQLAEKLLEAKAIWKQLEAAESKGAARCAQDELPVYPDYPALDDLKREMDCETCEHNKNCPLHELAINTLGLERIPAWQRLPSGVWDCAKWESRQERMPNARKPQNPPPPAPLQKKRGRPRKTPEEAK
jgi:hypothetical protein